MTQPCETCLDSCNNGHFWMFLSDSVSSTDRADPSGDRPLMWAHLPYSECDEPHDVWAAAEFGCR